MHSGFVLLFLPGENFFMSNTLPQYCIWNNPEDLSAGMKSFYNQFHDQDYIANQCHLNFNNINNQLKE